MPLVPLTTALAVGVVLGAWLWEQGRIPCGDALWTLVQGNAWVKGAISVAPLVLFPLAVSPPRDQWPAFIRFYGASAPVESHLAPVPGRRSIALYLFLGILLAWARPATPCLPADHVGVLAAQLDSKGRYAVLTGVVVGWPEERGAWYRYTVRAETLVIEGRRIQVQGRVLVRAPAYPALTYGTRARFVGWLRQPPVYETFDYRRYLARQGIYALFQARDVIPLAGGQGVWWREWLYAWRYEASMAVRSLFPEPYAALLNGILLGIESGIPRQLLDAFNATGASHIIVISGFNIAVLSGLTLALLTPLVGRRRAALVALVAIAVYVPLVGAEAAVVRAGLMGAVSALGMALQRQGHALNTLFAATLVMLAWHPQVLWDVGFQLSFLATLGLIVAHPALVRWGTRVVRDRFGLSVPSTVFSWVNEAVLVTLTAQLFTVPLIVAIFGRVSIVSPLVNALIVPVQPLIMLGGALSVVMSWLWGPLGRMFAWGTLVPLAWTVAVVEHVARWPGAGMPMSPSVRPLVWGYYVVVAGYVTWVYKRLSGDRGSLCRFLVAVTQHASNLAKQWAGVGVMLLAMGIGIIGGRALVAGWAERATLTRWPGGSLSLRADGLPAVVIPARGPRFVAAWEVVRRLPVRPTDIWVLAQGDAEMLAAVQLLFQTKGAPRLVVHPFLCDSGRACPEQWRAFLGALTLYGVPHRGVASGSVASIGGKVAFAYLPGAFEGVIFPLWVMYGQWVILAPPDIPPSAQQRLPAPPQGRDLLWPLPELGAGVWPDPQGMRSLAPTLVLYPMAVTYPPGSQAALQQVAQLIFDPERPLVLELAPTGEAQVIVGRWTTRKTGDIGPATSRSRSAAP